MKLCPPISTPMTPAPITAGSLSLSLARSFPLFLFLAGSCSLLISACSSSDGDSGLPMAPSGGASGALGGAAGGTASGQGGTTMGAAGSNGAGGGVCVPPTGGISVGGKTAFHYGINYAWASFGSDFGNNRRGVAITRAARLTSLMDMKAHGVDVVRWWVFPNFQGGGVNFDTTTNAPTGLGGTTAADIAAALDIAAQAGVHIEFTFFSFDTFKTMVNSTTVNPHNLAPLISTPAMLSALVSNVIVPFVNEVNLSANRDRVSSWDVINEPEWAISAMPTDGVDPPFSPQTTVTTVSYPVMLGFVKAAVDGLHGASDRPVTVGAAAMKWAKAWTGVGDFYTFHLYDWINADYPYTRSLASYGVTDKPVVLGEFPIQGLTGVPYATLVDTIYRLGYAGALAWSFNDTAFPWVPNNAGVKTFADQHPCAFSP
jgi:hypothetical protein